MGATRRRILQWVAAVAGQSLRIKRTPWQVASSGAEAEFGATTCLLQTDTCTPPLFHTAAVRLSVRADPIHTTTTTTTTTPARWPSTSLSVAGSVSHTLTSPPGGSSDKVSATASASKSTESPVLRVLYIVPTTAVSQHYARGQSRAHKHAPAGLRSVGCEEV